MITQSRNKRSFPLRSGRGNVVNNVRNDLSKGYEEVIVAVADKLALAKVTKQLIEAGLFIPPRVCVKIRDDVVGIPSLFLVGLTSDAL